MVVTELFPSRRRVLRAAFYIMYLETRKQISERVGIYSHTMENGK